MTHDHDAWERYAEEALARAQRHQESMVDTFGLSGDIQYHWDLDEATIVFSRAGTEFARGDLTMIGSVDHERQSFLWSWANNTLPATVVGEAIQIRVFGAEREFPLLSRPAFDAEVKLVTQAHVAAADVLNATGIWRDTSGPLELLFLIHNLRGA